MGTHCHYVQAAGLHPNLCRHIAEQPPEAIGIGREGLQDVLGAKDCREMELAVAVEEVDELQAWDMLLEIISEGAPNQQESYCHNLDTRH